MATLPVVRTITAFVSPSTPSEAEAFSWAAGAALAASLAALKSDGFEVQTVRVALSPFETWIDGDTEDTRPIDRRLAASAAASIAAASDGFSHAGGSGPPVLLTVGPATTPRGASAIPTVVREVPGVTASLDLGRASASDDEDALTELCPLADPVMSAAAARVMAELATTTPEAVGNFSFAALARMPPLVPFFPAAFAPPSGRDPLDPAGGDPVRVDLAVGLQHLNVTIPAAEERAKALDEAADVGRPRCAEVAAAAAAALLPHVRRIEELMDGAASGEAASRASQKLACGAAVVYAGADTSFAPNPGAPAMDRLFRAAGVPFPGAPGSVALASALTAACKTLGCPPPSRPRLLGYCGLMLPPLEDLGLAKAVRDGRLGVPALLSVSSVCGIGLDTVPVHVPGLFPALGAVRGGDGGAPAPAAGDAGDTEAPLRRVIDDVAALAYRLRKPLSCRLFPFPAEAGAETTFDHPHMCNTSVMII